MGQHQLAPPRRELEHVMGLVLVDETGGSPRWRREPIAVEAVVRAFRAPRIINPSEMIL